jgi:hypothetical protein
VIFLFLSIDNCGNELPNAVVQYLFSGKIIKPQRNSKLKYSYMLLLNPVQETR